MHSVERVDGPQQLGRLGVTEAAARSTEQRIGASTTFQVVVAGSAIHDDRQVHIVRDGAVIVAIARRHEKTLPQIVFRFALELDMLPLTGTTDEDHMRADLDVFDFSLSDDERETIANIALS